MNHHWRRLSVKTGPSELKQATFFFELKHHLCLILANCDGTIWCILRLSAALKFFEIPEIRQNLSVFLLTPLYAGSVFFSNFLPTTST